MQEYRGHLKDEAEEGVGQEVQFLAIWSCTDRYSSQFENNYFTEMCSGSEAGSYVRLIDFVYHATLGLRAIKKREED